MLYVGYTWIILGKSVKVVISQVMFVVCVIKVLLGMQRVYHIWIFIPLPYLV